MKKMHLGATAIVMVLLTVVTLLAAGSSAAQASPPITAPHGPNGGAENAGQGTLKVLASFDTYNAAALIVGSNGQLYGAGPQCCGNYGVIFSMDPSSGQISVLHTFDGGDGWKPLALLQGIDGNFYGVTEQGGGAGCTNGSIAALFMPLPRGGTRRGRDSRPSRNSRSPSRCRGRWFARLSTG